MISKTCVVAKQKTAAFKRMTFDLIIIKVISYKQSHLTNTNSYCGIFKKLPFLL